jgi:hypothetical protein
VGESYDVNGVPADGCEVADAPQDNHFDAQATNLGTFPCTDSASGFYFQGRMPSDARSHTTSFGRSVNTGAAPDMGKASATGGLTCVNDLEVSLETRGGSSTPCYRLTVTTDRGIYIHGLAPGAFGPATVIRVTSGAYSGGTVIRFTFEKICTGVLENVSYTVRGHL